jgi:hypothetical protein
VQRGEVTWSRESILNTQHDPEAGYAPTRRTGPQLLSRGESFRESVRSTSGYRAEHEGLNLGLTSGGG